MWYPVPLLEVMLSSSPWLRVSPLCPADDKDSHPMLGFIYR